MKTKKITLFLSFIVMMLIVCGSIQNADAKMKWKMTSTWTPSILAIESDKHFVEVVNQLAGDELEIKFYPGGTLVPTMEIFDAVRNGTIQMGADGPLYWAGKNSAFEPLCTLPLGLTSIDYMVWVYQGGGLELYQEAYGKFGMVYLPHGVNLESGIRSSKPIESLSDFKGLKMRTASRTTGKILKELGAAQTVLAGSELYTSLEKGVIDATEWSSPANDWGLGLQEVTKYWATPPWHQPAVLYGVMINKKAWDSLSEKLQAILKTAATANFLWCFSFHNVKDIEATNKFIEKGTKITRLSDEDLAKIQKLAIKYILEECKKNPLYAKIVYSQYKFLQDITKLREISTPFMYGRNPSVFPDLEKIKSYIK